MKTNPTRRLPGRCPQCDGTFLIDEGVNKCVACSRTIEGIQDMQRYYKYNRPEIEADLKALGRKAAREKWCIPGGTMSGLLARWAKKDKTPPPPPAPKPEKYLSVDGEGVIEMGEDHGPVLKPAGFPVLPAFSNDWTPEVQIKWLEAWTSRR